MENIAKAIEKSGKSRYQISNDTGIDNAVLCRIVSGGGCSIKTADILCKYLGLSIYHSNRGDSIMSKKVRSNAWNIQYQNTKRLNEMKKAGRINDSDYQHLKEFTRKLYEEAKEADKLKELKKIIER